MRDIWIHIHIPKCGGTSVADTLRANFGKSLRTTNSILNNYQYDSCQINRIINQYPDLKCLTGHKLSLDLPFDNAKLALHVFTWIRDPVDRFISHYYFHRYHRNNIVPEAKAMELEQYIEWALVQGNQDMYINGQTRFLTGERDISSVKLIEDHVEKNKLLLFPLTKLQESILILSKIFPQEFREPYVSRLNTTAGKVPLSTQTVNLIMEYCKTDQMLYQLAEKQYTKLLLQTFSDSESLMSELNTINKYSVIYLCIRRFKDAIRRLVLNGK